MYFESYFFKPLSHEQFIDEMAESMDSKSPEVLLVAYYGWVINYCRKAQYFYQYQYRKHSDITWKTFCVQLHIPEYEDPSNIGFDLEWKDWKEEHQLDKHYDKYQEAIQGLSSLQKLSESELESINIDTGEETVSYQDIDRIWFNKTVINNSTQVVEELRILPYEKYLQTPHWKKIRSAILLISKAVCRAEACSIVGESWYGGAESELDVHHLTYSNRGNERYDDLALLCRHHHELVHINMEDRGVPGIKIV